MNLHSDSPRGVTCAPLPGWVDHQPWPNRPDDPQGNWSDNGLFRLLYETQTSLLEPGSACHIRVVQHVLTRAGAEHASRIALDFDPSCERIEIHWIRVWRNQVAVDHARSDAFQMLRREAELERGALNGRLTAALVIADLRVDDILDVAFTRYWMQPVLGGHHNSWLIFSAYMPWLETRHRLARPIDRPVNMRAFNDPVAADVVTQNGIEISQWVMTHQERRHIEAQMPSWPIMNPCYQLSEFGSWSEVASLFLPHYDDSALPAGLAAEVEKVAAEYRNPAERAAAWLRFVQRTIRYFAMAIGDGGLVPRSLEMIWAQRLGDCKDASRLFVAGARALGLDSCVALVSTTHGLSLQEILPSVHMFNHAIARVRVGGSTYWLDPTVNRQEGMLDRIAPLHAGHALVLSGKNAGLESMSEAHPLPVVFCEDFFTPGPRPDSSAELRRCITLRYWIADDVRVRIENEGITKIATDLLGEVRSTWSSATETAAPAVRDDRLRNELVLTFQYRMDGCWQKSADRKCLEFRLPDTFTIKELAAIPAGPRRVDILLGRPRRVTWRAYLEMPCQWAGAGGREDFREPEIEFCSVLVLKGKKVTVERMLTVTSWSMAASRADVYQRALAELGRNETRLLARQRFGKLRPFARAGLTINLYQWRLNWAAFRFVILRIVVILVVSMSFRIVARLLTH